MSYEPVIGVEIHVQLSTRTKMFCGCALSFGDEPNTHTCPICLGHPGTLPVTNAEAVHYALMIAMAFDCEIAPRSIFHRKNYFYPDLPKGYQISQYDLPAGAERPARRRAHPPRAHGGGRGEAHRMPAARAGSTAPRRASWTSTAAARRWSRSSPSRICARRARRASSAGSCRRTLRRMGVSDVNMEEGSLRMDANVSHPPGGHRHARHEDRAQEHELVPVHRARRSPRRSSRQEQILSGGGQVEQETLHYDPQSGSLTSLRSKEEAHDYRYFPEPDLVPVAPTEEMLSARPRGAAGAARGARERLERDLELPADTARLLALPVGAGRLLREAVDGRE